MNSHPPASIITKLWHSCFIYISNPLHIPWYFKNWFSCPHISSNWKLDLNIQIKYFWEENLVDDIMHFRLHYSRDVYYSFAPLSVTVNSIHLAEVESNRHLQRSDIICSFTLTSKLQGDTWGPWSHPFTQ